MQFSHSYSWKAIKLPEGHLLCADGGYLHTPSFLSGLMVGTGFALILALLIMACYWRPGRG